MGDYRRHFPPRRTCREELWEKPVAVRASGPWIGHSPVWVEEKIG